MKLIFPIIIVVGLLFSASQLPPTTSQKLSLHVLDIGQGDSIYIRLPTQEDVLIDAGPDDRVLSQLGKYMPIGDRTIELLIISHNHADHIGGLDRILKEYTVNRIWISGAIHTTAQYIENLKLLKEKRIPTTVVKAGSVNTVGDVEFLVLHPPTDMTGQNPEDQHDATVVIKLTYDHVCALLTGDLNAGHEATIIKTATALNTSLNCSLLKVTHHGSIYGSSDAFLAAVKPKIAVISVGRENQYGHPSTFTLNRLKGIGAAIYRTDLQGTVSVTSDGTRFWTKTEK